MNKQFLVPTTLAAGFFEQLHDTLREDMDSHLLLRRWLPVRSYTFTLYVTHIERSDLHRLRDLVCTNMSVTLPDAYKARKLLAKLEQVAPESLDIQAFANAPFVKRTDGTYGLFVTFETYCDVCPGPLHATLDAAIAFVKRMDAKDCKEYDRRCPKQDIDWPTGDFDDNPDPDWPEAEQDDQQNGEAHV